MQELKTGDIVNVANARWTVIYVQGSEVRLLKLNDWAPEPKQADAPNVMTVEEAAAILKLSPKTVREHCKTGLIKGTKVGRTWRILRSENPALAG